MHRDQRGNAVDGEQAPAVHDPDAVAEPLCLLHVVSRVEDREAFRFERFDRVEGTGTPCPP